jgi:serine/threonine protein kinase
MKQLRGEPGLLQVLDLDTASTPHWFVTAEATLLDDHFAASRDLRRVVEAVAHLSTTLTRLHELDITHRDLKPDNLFWHDDEALLGDFGIAGLQDHMSLTDAGRKHGPWGYIAPEALNNDGLKNWAPADVYSLAKCLWKIARGENFPPQGTLYIREPDTSLLRVGGAPGLELGRLLELATAQRPHERPLMRDIRDELGVWLTQHPEGSVVPPQPTRRVHFSAREHLQRRAEARGAEGIARDCVHSVLDPLRPLRPGATQVTDANAGEIEAPPDVIQAITRGDPDWAPDFNPTLQLVWDDYPNQRVVGQAVGEHDFATYLAQWQHQDPEESWQAITPLRVATGAMWFPSDLAARTQLTDQLADDAPKIPGADP